MTPILIKHYLNSKTVPFFAGECYKKAKQALHTSVPDRLLCRDKEVKSISTFLQEHLSKKKAASMYISGAPGTGKTACLSSILRENKVSAYAHLQYKLTFSRWFYIHGLLYNVISNVFYYLRWQ